MPGLATPGGEDNAILVDLAQELSTENFQHSQVRADVVQAALRALEKTSPGFNGRRNLFWLAETFPPGGSAAGAPGSSGNALQVFGTDPTSRIAIYPISVLGLESDAIGAEMNGNGVTLGGTPGTPALEAQLDDRRSARQQLRESMEHIAAQTGGEAFFGTNDLAAALHKALSDGENYYSLAYSPTNRNWNDRFRRIEVKLARRGTSLTYRQGYLATSAPTTAAVSTDHPDSKIPAPPISARFPK
jgi:VWFA-related protein